MLRKLTVLCAVVVYFNITNASAQNAPVTDCDKLAADPYDPQRKASGDVLGKNLAIEAISACEAALRQYPNDARLRYQLGRAYNNSGNLQGAFDQYRKAADQGNAAAQNNLGLMYQNGQGVSQDDTQAVASFRKAADQGLAAAQNNLGFMYQNGRGVAKDDAQALVWYRKAADQGNAEAQKNLEVAERNLGGLPPVNTPLPSVPVAPLQPNLGSAQQKVDIKGFYPGMDIRLIAQTVPSDFHCFDIRCNTPDDRQQFTFAVAEALSPPVLWGVSYRFAAAADDNAVISQISSAYKKEALDNVKEPQIDFSDVNPDGRGDPIVPQINNLPGRIAVWRLTDSIYLILIHGGLSMSFQGGPQLPQWGLVVFDFRLKQQNLIAEKARIKTLLPTPKF